MEPPSFISGKAFLYREQRSLHVYAEQLVEVLFGDAAQGSGLTGSGVGEDDVDSPPLCLGGFVEPIKIRQFGDVTLNAGDVAPYCSHCLVKFFVTTSHNEDMGSFLDEQLRCGESYSCGATSDYRHLSFQLAHWILSLSR
jgi:hypothetical protein